MRVKFRLAKDLAWKSLKYMVPYEKWQNYGSLCDSQKPQCPAHMQQLQEVQARPLPQGPSTLEGKWFYGRTQVGPQLASFAPTKMNTRRKKQYNKRGEGEY